MVLLLTGFVSVKYKLYNSKSVSQVNRANPVLKDFCSSQSDGLLGYGIDDWRIKTNER